MTLHTCNGTVVAGGAIHHTTLCPMHGEAPEVRAARAYDRGRRAGWAEAIAALRSSPQLWMVGWSNAELDIVADHLADQAPKEETHG